MEKLRQLRRSSVVSARVYSRDCEANVEKERKGVGGEPFSTLAQEREERSHFLLILMWWTIILWDIIPGEAEKAAG